LINEREAETSLFSASASRMTAPDPTRSTFGVTSEFRANIA
jgi:hypothetical protein